MATGKVVSTIEIVFLVLTISGSQFLGEGISSIRPGEELNSTSSLLSQGGKFTLGFFTEETSNGHGYFGIWYTEDEQKTKVWVANPNAPVPNDTGVLALESSGILRIASGGRTILVLSDQTAADKPIATLEDSGNFILVDETEKRTLWQSFGHPNNVLLPGMKLGFSSAENWNTSLLSWLNYSFPASGSFKLTWEPRDDSGQLVMYRRGEPYWTSGQLKDQKFEYMNVNLPFNEYQYNLVSVSNNDEKYFTFEATAGSKAMLLLEPRGGIMMGTSSPYVKNPDFCYGYESNDGCVASGIPQCRNKGDKFVEKRAYFPTSTTDFDGNSSLSLSDCMEKCWSTCNCVGFYNNENGCMIYKGKLEYREDAITAEIVYVLVRGNSSKGKVWLWVVIAVAISLLVLILGIFCSLRIRKLRQKAEEERKRKKYLQDFIASDSFKDVENDGAESHDLKILSLASIAEATNNFSEGNKLGKGGFGPVYKGKLQDGREIAIKRLSRTSGQGLVEFKNELILISKLQHKNLVRVLGCCISEEEKMLIYEYLPNKSLDLFIFDRTKGMLLDWKKRVIIIEGIAQGLLYLHKYSRMRVIHRDLKASNVLLDDNMNPKISDFGLARIIKQNETEAVTKRIVGTYGYMSPEYAMEGTVSEKSDVFSFGVLVLEIVSGRRNSSFHQSDEGSLNLIGFAWELWKEGSVSGMKDPTLGDSCDDYKLFRTIHVGLLCVQEAAADRPAMSEAIAMLSNESMVLPAPKQLAFFTGRRREFVASASDGKPGDYSENKLTISEIQAR